MSTLVVVGYDEPYQADEVLLKLRKLQRDYLLDLEDLPLERGRSQSAGCLECGSPVVQHLTGKNNLLIGRHAI